VAGGSAAASKFDSGSISPHQLVHPRVQKPPSLSSSLIRSLTSTAQLPQPHPHPAVPHTPPLPACGRTSPRLSHAAPRGAAPSATSCAGSTAGLGHPAAEAEGGKRRVVRGGRADKLSVCRGPRWRQRVPWSLQSPAIFPAWRLPWACRHNRWSPAAVHRLQQELLWRSTRRGSGRLTRRACSAASLIRSLSPL
jgi:hypothetical protein